MRLTPVAGEAVADPRRKPPTSETDRGVDLMSEIKKMICCEQIRLLHLSREAEGADEAVFCEA